MKEEEDDVKRLKADMRRSFIFLAPGYEKEVDLIEEGLSLNLQQQNQSLDYFLFFLIQSTKIKFAYITFQLWHLFCHCAYEGGVRKLLLNGWRKDDPGMIFRIRTEWCWRGNDGDGDDGDDSDGGDDDGDDSDGGDDDGNVVQVWCREVVGRPGHDLEDRPGG